MWSGIQKLCHNQFKPKTILVDFVISAHSSIREVFADCILKFCAFHLSQAWYRKIVSVVFQHDYVEGTLVGKSLKHLFVLPYLSENEGKCVCGTILYNKRWGYPMQWLHSRELYYTGLQISAFFRDTFSMRKRSRYY